MRNRMRGVEGKEYVHTRSECLTPVYRMQQSSNTIQSFPIASEIRPRRIYVQFHGYSPLSPTNLEYVSTSVVSTHISSQIAMMTSPACKLFRPYSCSQLRVCEAS